MGSSRRYYDALTGLPTRALADRQLRMLLSRAEADAALALVLIDLRNMRHIIACLGQQMGDDALREVAARLRECTAAGDTLARAGDSEFLLIAASQSEEHALAYAEQLANTIDGGLQLSGASLDLHVACGVCLYPAHGNTADEILQRAQVALEDADQGGARVAIYRPGRDKELRRRLTLVTDLRVAIEESQLSLVFQPKVTMAARSVKSLEALLRWNHPQLGPVSPAEFVPLAESTGGSRRLTSWVLAAAIRQMAEWRRDGMSVEAAVNLSAPDILDRDLPDEVLRLLGDSRIDTTSLLLEITESAVMRDPRLAARNMQILRSAGVRFAIDDFGTGHSSLSLLSALPVDELKLDRSLIAHAHRKYELERIVSSTIELAHSIGLNIVAEGVEDAESWNFLRRLGCDYAQGYLISAPLAADAVPGFVGDANRLLIASDSTVAQIRALRALVAMG